jgi:hypothetical protein
VPGRRREQFLSRGTSVACQADRTCDSGEEHSRGVNTELSPLAAVVLLDVAQSGCFWRRRKLRTARTKKLKQVGSRCDVAPVHKHENS